MRISTVAVLADGTLKVQYQYDGAGRTTSTERPMQTLDGETLDRVKIILLKAANGIKTENLL